MFNKITVHILRGGGGLGQYGKNFLKAFLTGRGTYNLIVQQV